VSGRVGNDYKRTLQVKVGTVRRWHVLARTKVVARFAFARRGHDIAAAELPRRTVLLTLLCEDQAATVLQLPAQPTTPADADAQKRVTYVG
jgi:hypothetical protein